ncbi:MAG TPA: hypothetical protein VGL75_07320 [Acidothermaceae bacterium]|jgi:hypothetical protein
MTAPLQWFKHTYHLARDYGWPHGTVQPGEVIQAVQPPEPAFFEKVDGPDETAPQVTDPVEVPAVEPVVTTDVPPVEVPAEPAPAVTTVEVTAAASPVVE